MTARKGPAPVKQSTAAFELRSRYFMLRAPILSLVDSKQLLGDDASLQKNLLKLPFVEEAIFVASNNLHERAYRTPYESGRDSKLDLALGRYLSRMATRPTPFGLFSSVSIGHLRSNAPSLALRASHVRRHVRLDNELLCAICATLLSTDSVSRAIRWFPNDTLLRLGESYRYTEVAIVNGQRTFKLSQAAADDALECAISSAHGGATLERVESSLAQAFPDIEPVDIRSFVSEMVSADLLSPELQPSLTGEDGLQSMLRVLRDRNVPADLFEALESAAADLSALNRSNDQAAPDRYQSIFDHVKQLQPTAKPAKAFQVDCYRDGNGLTLDESVLTDIANAVKVCLAFPPSAHSGLTSFKEKFRQRYDRRRIPLLLATDEESGISVADVRDDTAPILDGMPFGRQKRASIELGAMELFLFAKLEHAIASKERVVRLDPADFPGPKSPDKSVPQFLSAMFSLVQLAGEERPHIILNSLSGPSGASLIGRFCHGSEALCTATQAFLAAEAASDLDACYAEITHLPQGRIGNISARPLLRDHEIVFRARSGAKIEQQLTLSDLSLQLDGNELTLWSDTIGKRVVPRLTCAHNITQDTIGAYRLLGLLQHEGYRSLHFGWGSLANVAGFLPRLVCGQTIFSLARWRLIKSEIDEVSKHPDGGVTGMQELRKRRGLDTIVGLVDGDNVLRISTTNADSVTNFLSLVATRDFCIVQEVLDDEAGAVLQIDDRPHAHEIVMPLELVWQ